MSLLLKRLFAKDMQSKTYMLRGEASCFSRIRLPIQRFQPSSVFHPLSVQIKLPGSESRPSDP